jgi:hypothetical protein
MPVSTLSAALSTSIYTISLLLLLGILVYPVHDVFDSSRQRAADVIVRGLAAELNSLAPGMTSRLEVAPVPGTSISIGFAGKTVSVTVDGAASSEPVRWMLPQAALAPGRWYTVSLRDGLVDLA